MITNYISNACGYKIPRLKDVVYLVDKSTSKVINIDSGEASATITNTSPTRLEGFGIRLTEEESLDERYLFVKTVNVSINGHFSIINDDYLVVVEDYEGNYYLVNVDFPSKTTYTYTLSEGKDQTDLTFTSNSNYPLLKLTWNVVNTTNCKAYSYGGIKNLKLIEKGWARVDAENNSITLYDNHTFKDVGFNDASCVLTETYDGNNITNSITFDIPLDKAQSSWQYNLIEFKQNVYIAEILPKNSDHALMIGFENGLQPSYNVQGSTSNGDTSKITITLEEMSHRGLEELVNWSVSQDTNKKWVYIKQIDHRNAYTCIGHGVGRYDYMAEVDQDGNVLGNYKIYSGANRNKFPYINIVGYFHDVVTFSSTICSCSDDYMYEFNNHYYCVNGDKVQALESIHTYDCGRSGEINGTGSPISDYTKLGALVEPHSNFCDTNVEYMWVLKTDKFECVSLENRWVESGYTCGGAMGYDKYLVEKEQIWDSNQGWVDTNPLVTRETLVEEKSEYCGYQPPLPLYFQANAPSTVTFRKSDLFRNKTVVYSLDDGVTWNTLNSSNETTISLSTGDKMRVKGDGTTQAYAGSSFRIYGDVYVGGNVMSLLYPDTYTEELDLPPKQSIYYETAAFGSLFEGSTGITSCSYELLPATGLTQGCYYGMFSGCKNLTTVPELPATIIPSSTPLTSYGCYQSMFQGCTSLTSLPSDLLPATTLGNNCYNGMFKGCTSLTAAPVLSATTLANGCYYSMFSGCTSLTITPELPATTLTDNCYQQMFSRCTSLSASTDFSNVTSVGSGSCKSMFYGCTGITSIPSLIVGGDYMFSGCTSLTGIPVVRHGYAYMFAGCTALTSVIINGISGGKHMFEGCTSLTGATGTVYAGGKSGCTAMFSGCTALTVAPELPDTTLYDGCYKDMFAYCTSLRTAPVLPATHAIYEGDRIPEALRPTYYETDCYEGMFNECSSLNYVKCLVTNTPSCDSCRIKFSGWLYGVSPTGTFVKSANSYYGSWTRGSNGIPDGWTIQDAT